MSIGDFFRVKSALWSEQATVIRRYYPKSVRFALADLALGLCSLFFNPYRHGRKRGEIYGETPLTTLHRIADLCHLTASDTWLELGSGRGKSCFWIAQFAGCRAIGLEKIPLFTHLARFLSSLFQIRADFQQGDMFEADFSAATCVYVYSTCLSDEQLSRLAQRMTSLPPGARIVTISAPLPGWPHRPFPISFPWGQAEAYLHTK
jgi:SAM-dependent methyltransferase